MALVPRFRVVMLTPAMCKHYGIDAFRVVMIPDCCDDWFFEGSVVPVETRFSPARPLRLRCFGVIILWKG
jgi:hypothetical protein